MSEKHIVFLWAVVFQIPLLVMEKCIGFDCRCSPLSISRYTVPYNTALATPVNRVPHRQVVLSKRLVVHIRRVARICCDGGTRA
ncbi:hypothetical protein B0H14DRAFT_3854071 [Mycena olivaceomarginata]|nr:hypothetical protein B0H14DRAFT_3854071 [Mycena olivaceomarginata]